MTSKPKRETVLTIGENRGAARLWIQGRILSDNGWHPGKRWQLTATAKSIRLVAEDNGPRKVAGNESRPVIDSKDPAVGRTFPIGTRVKVRADQNSIRITAAE